MAVVSASIEDILHIIYWKMAGLSDAVGAVITGDARPNRLTEDIIKIARGAKVDAKIIEDLSDIFTAYRDLATKRNQCIHWTWNAPKGKRIVVEPPTYKTGAQPVTFTLKEMRTLADDLVWIETRLDVHAMSPAELQAAKSRTKNANIYVPTPWLDKPPPPSAKQ